MFVIIYFVNKLFLEIVHIVHRHYVFVLGNGVNDVMININYIMKVIGIVFRMCCYPVYIVKGKYTDVFALTGFFDQIFAHVDLTENVLVIGSLRIGRAIFRRECQYDVLVGVAEGQDDIQQVAINGRVFVSRQYVIGR